MEERTTRRRRKHYMPMPLSIRVSQEQREYLEARAAHEGVSVGDVVRGLIDSHGEVRFYRTLEPIVKRLIEEGAVTK